MAIIEAIATTYLEADAANVTFSSIPATYEHLQIRGSLRGASNGTLAIQLNSDTGSNYSRHQIYGAGSSASTNLNAGIAFMNIAYVTWTDESSETYSAHTIDFLDYANTNKNTSVQSSWGFANDQVSFNSQLWDDTSAVSTIKLYEAGAGANFVRGSEFTLYGIKSS
mgnify:CR=1 FL=1